MSKKTEAEHLKEKMRNHIVNQFMGILDDNDVMERVEITADTEYGDTDICIWMETQSLEFHIGSDEILVYMQEISHDGMLVRISTDFEKEGAFAAFKVDLEKLIDVFVTDFHNYMFVVEGLAKFSSEFALGDDGICSQTTWRAMNQYYNELVVADDEEVE